MLSIVSMLSSLLKYSNIHYQKVKNSFKCMKYILQVMYMICNLQGKVNRYHLINIVLRRMFNKIMMQIACITNSLLKYCNIHLYLSMNCLRYMFNILLLKYKTNITRDKEGKFHYLNIFLFSMLNIKQQMKLNMLNNLMQTSNIHLQLSMNKLRYMFSILLMMYKMYIEINILNNYHWIKISQ